jgi:hypothetical protein
LAVNPRPDQSQKGPRQTPQANRDRSKEVEMSHPRQLLNLLLVLIALGVVMHLIGVI